jgi:hypothetical protein
MSWRLLGMLDDVECQSPTAKLILVKLVDRADDDGRNIYPSIARIAAFAGCSERQTKRVMAAFCAVGLLRIVKEGGKGPGSTRHYELSIDMLRRMALETWEAIAGRHAQDACADDDEGADSGVAKGDTMSPLEPGRVTPATSKGDTHVTQPLRGTLKPEREGAHERGQDPSPASDAPDAGHATDAEDAANPPEGSATLAQFRKLWPTTLADDNARVESAWSALPFEERRPAIDGIRPFLAGLKGLGRRNLPSGATYLGQRKWRDVPAMAAEKQAQEFVDVAAWSRPWWAVLFHRLKIGQPCGYMLQQAIDGKSPQRSARELSEALAAYPDLPAFLCDGPEMTAWRPWFEAMRLRIPDFSGRTFRVFLPAALPPGGKREEGDDDVRF